MLQLESLVDRFVVDFIRLHKIGCEIYKSGSIQRKAKDSLNKTVKRTVDLAYAVYRLPIGLLPNQISHPCTYNQPHQLSTNVVKQHLPVT